VDDDSGGVVLYAYDLVWEEGLGTDEELQGGGVEVFAS
jgi:hypothetical protein